MLTFKQRYKPRTEREYTKSDLTVYDSAGNTALNTLKVYGKSEVVDGAIKSAGEGWSTVDLGTLTWDITSNRFFTRDIRTTVRKPISYAEKTTAICAKYISVSASESGTVDNSITIDPTGDILIHDETYTTVSDFVASLGNATLCYPLADPTQGNTIAIKTDDGSGINGTMATFSTGTPLYGVSDTIRDVMEWDGSAGTVTKKCAGIDISAVGWKKNTVTIQGVEYVYWTRALADIRKPTQAMETPTWILSDKYEPIRSTAIVGNPSKISMQPNGVVLISTEAPTDDTVTPSGSFVYELATPTTEQLTQTENDSIASLRTFNGTTHFTNNATTDMTVNYTIKVPTIS